MYFGEKKFYAITWPARNSNQIYFKSQLIILENCKFDIAIPSSLNVRCEKWGKKGHSFLWPQACFMSAELVPETLFLSNIST